MQNYRRLKVIHLAYSFLIYKSVGIFVKEIAHRLVLSDHYYSHE